MATANLLDIEIDLMQHFIILTVIDVLAYSNSLFNPIIYFITSRDYWKAGYQLCKCLSCDRQDIPTTDMLNTAAAVSINTGTTIL